MSKPDQPRHELSWKEMKVIMDRFRSVVAVLDGAADEFQESAQAAILVLRSLHKKWTKITRIVKQLTFRPSRRWSHPVSIAAALAELDELDECMNCVETTDAMITIILLKALLIVLIFFFSLKADEFDHAIKDFTKTFREKVTPSIGAQNYGKKGYFKLPMHILECHTTSDIRWLWDNFKVVIGQLSGEVVENKNQDICKFASQHTNNGTSDTSVYNSLYFQMIRYMLIQTYCFPDTMFELKSDAPNTLPKLKCHRCGVVGAHTKGNKKKCVAHPDYHGPEVLSSDED